jgi:hypothetical protein
MACFAGKPGSAGSLCHIDRAKEKDPASGRVSFKRFRWIYERTKRRRKTPAAPSTPVPSSARLEGSGVAPTVTGAPFNEIVPVAESPVP